MNALFPDALYRILRLQIGVVEHLQLQVARLGAPVRILPHTVLPITFPGSIMCEEIGSGIGSRGRKYETFSFPPVGKQLSVETNHRWGLVGRT